MARGRRPRSDAAPTRALEVQRAFRERRRKYIADLENTVRELRQENVRLREMLAMQQQSATQVPAGQLYQRPDGPLGSLVDGAAGQSPFTGPAGIPIQVAEILPSDPEGRAGERAHDAPAFYELHAPLASATAGGNQRIFRHGIVSFPSPGALDPAPNHTHLPPAPAPAPAPAPDSASLSPADMQHGDHAFSPSSLSPHRYQPAGHAVANGSSHGYGRLPRPHTASYVNVTGRLVSSMPNESTGYQLTLGLSPTPNGPMDKPRLLAPAHTVGPPPPPQAQSSSSSHWPNNHSPIGFVSTQAPAPAPGAGPHTAESSPVTYPHPHFPPPPPSAPVLPFPSVSRTPAEADPDRTAPASLSPQPPPGFWSPFQSPSEPTLPPSSSSNNTPH